MAVMRLQILGLVCLFHQAYSFGIFDDLISDTGKCEDICSNTYPLHTYEKGVHLGYCKRGCRLFTIIDFVHDDENLNNTKDSCSYSCQEAHQDKEDLNACSLGCDSQVNLVAKKKQKFSQLDMLQPPQDFLTPFMYVHNLYSNMIDKFNRHTSISWSFYMQNNNGNLVVVKSGPHVNTDRVNTMLTDDDDDMFEDDYKTSNYIETNIASLDNSITPNVKHSQVYGLETDLDGINYAANTRSREEQAQDWLGCIAKKTGLPRVLLSLTIFVSAIVMIWLCFTTAATAPDQRVPSQKLSIYGDLDYLSQLNDKALLANVHPQDTMEASPLPIKIKVERI